MTSLALLHENNIIHCDVKPQNFLLFTAEMLGNCKAIAKAPQSTNGGNKASTTATCLNDEFNERREFEQEEDEDGGGDTFNPLNLVEINKDDPINSLESTVNRRSLIENEMIANDVDSNISFTSYEDLTEHTSLLKITDFGLSHIISEGERTAYVKFPLGTHNYKAPEIVNVKYQLMPFN